MNLEECIEFLKFYPNIDRRSVSHLLNYASELYFDMKYCISVGSWSGFYWKYRDQMDYMIQKSRDQRVIDFTIEQYGDCFENLESRDMATNFKKPRNHGLPEDYSQLPTPLLPMVEPENNLADKKLKKEVESSGTKSEIKDYPIACNLKQPIVVGCTQLPKPSGCRMQTPASVSATVKLSETIDAAALSGCLDHPKEQIFEPDLDPDRLSRMEHRKTRNQVKKLKTELAEQKKMSEQKISELQMQQESMQSEFNGKLEQFKTKMINSFIDQISGLAAEIGSREEIGKKGSNQEISELKKGQESLREEFALKIKESETRMMKLLEEKMLQLSDEQRLRDTKLEDFMKLMTNAMQNMTKASELPIQENEPKVVDSEYVEKVTINGSEYEKNLDEKVPVVKNEDPSSVLPRYVTNQPSTSENSSYYDEFNDIEAEKKQELGERLDEQNRVYEEKLRVVQQKRSELNEKAQGEIAVIKETQKAMYRKN